MGQGQYTAAMSAKNPENNPSHNQTQRKAAESPGNRRKTGGAVPNCEATQFKLGQSGNPAGRPRMAPLSQAYRDKLSAPVPHDPQGRTFAQAIADSLAERALAGDIRAAQELADRAEGKPRQSLEIENVTLREAFERMSVTELENYAATGKLPEWFAKYETIQ